MPTDTMLDLAAILETYLSAWNAADPGERLALLERSVTDEVVFIDPMKNVKGRGALAAHIAETRAAFPDIAFVSEGESDSHNNVVRQRWAAVQDGEVVLRGLDVDDIAPDGRLGRIIGFFDRG